MNNKKSLLVIVFLLLLFFLFYGCAEEIVPIENRSGIWEGTTKFGIFIFMVDPSGRFINRIEYEYLLKCYPNIYPKREIQHPSEGWPIDDHNRFDLEIGNSERKEKFKGEFNSAGTVATGIWRVSKNCSSKFKATKCSPALIQNLNPIPPTLKVWGGPIIKSISLVVKESYPNLEDKKFAPVTRTIVEILNRMGIRIIGDNEKGDAAMTIDLTGKAIRSYYYTIGSSSGSKGEYYYTGAEVKGKINLSAPGRDTLSFTIYEKITPSLSLIPGTRPNNPKSAPIYSACMKAILRVFATNLWGPQVLVQSLWGPTNRTYYYTVENELKQFGRESLLALLQALRNDECELDIRIAAARELGELFSPDPLVVYELNEILNKAKSTDIRLRKTAALALGELGRKPGGDIVIESILQALQNESCTLRMAAAEALERMGAKAGDKAIFSLINALEKNESEWMRTMYGVALNKITGKKFWKDVKKWKRWMKQQE